MATATDRPNVRAAKNYWIYYPPDMWPNDVLLHAKDYTIGEPRIIAYPDSAGMYVVGYCDYEGVTQFAKVNRQLWDGKRAIDPLTKPAEVKAEIEYAKQSNVRFRKLLESIEIVPTKEG